MPDFVTNEEARAMLKAVCRQHGTVKAFAERLGIAPCTISLMRSGLRRVNETVAGALGLRAVQGFVRVTHANDLHATKDGATRLCSSNIKVAHDVCEYPNG